MIHQENDKNTPYLIGAMATAFLIALLVLAWPEPAAATGGNVEDGSQPTDLVGTEVVAGDGLENEVMPVPDHPTGYDKLILDQLVQLTTGIEHLTASLYDANTLERGKQTEESEAVHIAVIPAPEPSSSPPWADEHLLVWEGEGCITPPDVRIAHLCGARAGDGYVVRWVNAPGDNFAGRVADAAYMDAHAFGLEDATLLWSRPHPRTGQPVAIHYLQGDRALQLTISGLPVYRVDREHDYRPFN